MPRPGRRHLVVLILLLTSVLTGCLDNSEKESDSTPEAARDDEASNATGPQPSAPGGNVTGPQPSAPGGNVTGPPYAPGWPSLDEARIRPGVKLFAPVDETATNVEYHQCTAAFIFGSPDNRTLYIATAAHCVKTLDIGTEIPVANGAANAILVYCSWGIVADTPGSCPAGETTDPGFDNDLALLEIPDEARSEVHPAVLHWGGPTGIAGNLSRGEPVLTYGNTDARDLDQDVPDVLDARTGWVYEKGPWVTDVELNPTGARGDSGSPLITESGLAVGIVSNQLWIDCPGPRGDTMGITNLDQTLAYLHEHTDLQVGLHTWPLIEKADVPDRPELPCD